MNAFLQQLEKTRARLLGRPSLLRRPQGTDHPTGGPLPHTVDALGRALRRQNRGPPLAHNPYQHCLLLVPLPAQVDSHEAAISRGRREIQHMVEHFRITPSGEAVDASHRLYKIALQRGFTRGRRVNQVRNCAPGCSALQSCTLSSSLR